MLERRRFLTKIFAKKLHDSQKNDQIPPLAMFNQDVIGKSIFSDGYFEIREIKCIKNHIIPKIKNRKIFLDIGANIGNQSVFFSDNFEKVKSFEPNPRTIKLLEANAMLKSNIEVNPFGLSDQEAVLDASFNTSNVGAASIGTNTNREIKVKFSVKPLDSVLSKNEQKNISMIKIDVEGHELKALKGARKTLEHSYPIILMEANKSDIHDGSTHSIKYLSEIGYKHFYELVDSLHNRIQSKPIQKFINAISVIATGKRISGNYKLMRINGPLRSENYKIIVCSTQDLEL